MLFNPFRIIIFCVMILKLDGRLEFESRWRNKFDKQIDSNVMMNSKGLDQGIDL